MEGSARNDWLIENQQTVRSANERLQAVAAGVVPTDQLVPFLCECADGSCLGRVDMKVAEYDEIHSDRDRYSIIHDHELANGEAVIEERALFDVVSKRMNQAV
ncbi:MAG: hypothetical protein E6G19_05215 [Actinobacteria bacterium]|nr:MAG: hypothetical protein E6G19_05215 [Actinomycetota bacterium]